jgi:hypothetical protein
VVRPPPFPPTPSLPPSLPPSPPPPFRPHGLVLKAHWEPS